MSRACAPWVPRSSLDGGTIQATAPHGLHGADILLPQPSVGATENLLLAAVLASGRTTIRNAAREPEIADLAACLTAWARGSRGIGSHVLTIDGGTPLAGAVHTVMPDRIEFGTLACAAAVTDGELVLPNGRIDLLGAAAPLFDAAGVALRDGRGRRYRAPRRAAACAASMSRPAPIPSSRPICRRRPWRCWRRFGRQRNHRDDLRAALPPRR